MTHSIKSVFPQSHPLMTCNFSCTLMYKEKIFYECCILERTPPPHPLHSSLAVFICYVSTSTDCLIAEHDCNTLLNSMVLLTRLDENIRYFIYPLQSIYRNRFYGHCYCRWSTRRDMGPFFYGIKPSCRVVSTVCAQLHETPSHLLTGFA